MDITTVNDIVRDPAAIMFDLDGVIVDTEPTYSIFWGETGRKYGVEGDDFADRIKGTTLPKILNGNFDESVHRQIISDLEEYERNMNYRLFDGAETLLSVLNRRGVLCAIVTSSNLDKMANLWKQHPQLKTLFKAIITDEDVTRSKPDPQPYLIGAERLGVDPARCIVIEDSYNGLLSGRAASAVVIGLATTNPRETLVDKADIVVDSISDLIPLFDIVD